MAFQDNVKRLRDEKRYTQAELGDLVGVAQQVIADLFPAHAGVILYKRR